MCDAPRTVWNHSSGQDGLTISETRTSSAPPTIERREGYAHHNASPIVGLQTSNQPSVGTSAAAINSADHCDVCTMNMPAMDTSANNCGFASLSLVSPHASVPNPKPTNSASAQ